MNRRWPRSVAAGRPWQSILCEAHELSPIDDKYYFSGSTNPAQQISLRHMSDNTFSIVLRGNASAGTPRGRQ